MDTKYFGTVDIGESELISFPDGLPGFEEVKKYALIPFFEGEENMLCLQSAEGPEPAFVVLNPFTVCADYVPRMTDEDLAVLNSDKDTPLAFYAITVVGEDFRDSTVNLKCPLAINPAQRLGKQVIMEDTHYSMHASINGSESKEG